MNAHKLSPSRERPPRPAPLTRGAAIPLYHQIYLTLRDEILRGDRPYGSAMPTEMELGASYDVSRITARRALEELAGGGYVERRRRLGTRVIYRVPAPPIEASIDQAVESLIAFGQKTAVKVIDLGTTPADATLAQKLGVEEGAPVIRAVRLRMAKGSPLGLIVSHMRSDLGLSVTPARLTGTPMLSLLLEVGIQIGGAVQTIEAIAADPELAEKLAIEARAPVLHIERLVEDRSKRTILVTSAFYRADRYRITLDMHQQNQFSPTYG